MNPSRALARPTTLKATPYRPACRSACESSARTSHRPTVPKPTSQTAAASPRGREVSHTSKRDRPAHRRTGQTPAAFARTDSKAKTRAPQTPHGAPRQEGSSLQRGAIVSAAPSSLSEWTNRSCPTGGRLRSRLACGCGRPRAPAQLAWCSSAAGASRLGGTLLLRREERASDPPGPTLDRLLWSRRR
jgi:hypothetical protein